jgi:hypothetical protein
LVAAREGAGEVGVMASYLRGEAGREVEEGDDKLGRAVGERGRGGFREGFLGWSAGLLPRARPKLLCSLFLFCFLFPFLF